MDRTTTEWNFSLNVRASVLAVVLLVLGLVYGKALIMFPF